MTEGKSFRLILQFAVPLVFGNLFQQLYNMADSIIVGKVLGLNALTAVGATTSVNFLIIGFVLGLCSGMGIPIAQQFGAKKHSEMRGYVVNAAYLSIALAVVLTILAAALCGPILRWMSTPESVFQGAYDYFFVICLGIPFTILYNTSASVIRALGDSRTPFYFLVFSAILNVGLDLLFVMGFDSGVAGAAWATIMSQGIAGAACFLYMKRTYRILKTSGEERRVNGRYLKVLLMNSVPMGLQFSITAIGSIMLQSAVNGLEEVYVSAFAAAMKVKQLAMCAYEGIATACATFASQNLGAGKLHRIRKGLLSGITIGIIYSVIIGIALMTNGSKIAWLFVDRSETEVLDAVQLFMTCTGGFYWMLAVLNCVRLTVQGLGYSRIAVLAGCSELVARGLMSLFVIPAFGFMGACFTDQTAWLAACIVLVAVYVVIMRRLKRQYGK